MIHDRLVFVEINYRVVHNEETDQLVIYGMGELHLDIVKDRLAREYNLTVYLGPTLVAYREQVINQSPIIEHHFHRFDYFIPYSDRVLLIVFIC